MSDRTDVKIYNAESAVFAAADFSLTELPPVPQDVLDTLLEQGGVCDGKPNVRIVSGLDESITEYVGGRWWRKYAIRVHDRKEYTILHKPDGSKRILSPQEAKVMQKMKNPPGVMLTSVENHVTEIGIPRYFVEYYKPPQMFGTPEAWEKVRYFQTEEGVTIDLMGEFPHEGVYETWFAIEDAVEENGEVVETRFRQIDDVALELILAKIEHTKQFSQSEQHTALRKEVNDEFWRKTNATKEEIKDIVADHVDRLID